MPKINIKVKVKYLFEIVKKSTKIYEEIWKLKDRSRQNRKVWIHWKINIIKSKYLIFNSTYTQFTVSYLALIRVFLTSKAKDAIYI